MPGKLALAIEIFALVLFVLFVAWSVKGIHSQKALLRQRHFYSAIIFCAVTLLMAIRTFEEIKLHLFLYNLTTSSVARISVGEREIDRREDLAVVIPSLNDVDWFLVNHGGWGEEVPLKITLKNGKVQIFSVGRYRRQEGAVLDFGQHGGFGSGFCRQLPSALNKIGIQLP
ncbi:MAG TPA: hypothetical protein VI685_02085 [Candidatus Angelobacter sp.]